MLKSISLTLALSVALSFCAADALFAVAVPLQQPTATGDQAPTFVIANTIDANGATGWAPNLSAQTAAYETVSDTGGPDRTRLQFTFDQNFGTAHTLGKFRLAATTANRGLFANGVSNGGDVGASGIWTTLVPEVALGTGAPTFTINADNTILLSGTSPTTSQYTVTATTGLTAITGLRLELIEDPSLPPFGAGGGPGRASNGNLVLSEFAVDAAPVADNQVVLRNPTAIHSQTNFPIGNTLLAGSGGWANSAGGDNTAVFETKDDTGTAGGTLLTVTMDHQANANHNIGRYRISTTTDDRSTFADNLENSGDVTATWTPIAPVNVVSTGGATAQVLTDDSVLMGGTNAANDTYTISILTQETGITGLRLEAIEDSTLPPGGLNGGPGRFTNGNFVLTEFSATADAAAAAGPVDIGLQNPTAFHSQGGFSVDNIIVNNTAGWANSGTPTDNVAVVETMGDAAQAGGTTLTFTVDHQSTFADHNVGKLRLSVTAADRSQFADDADNGGLIGPDSIWKALRPASVVSSSGAVGTIDVNGDILFNDVNAATDTYTITAHTNIPGITGIRLDTLTDTSLPNNGPGTNIGNGNFVVTHLAATTEVAAAGTTLNVPLQNATALRSQLSAGGLTVDKAIDGLLGTGSGTGWGDDTGTTDNVAVFETMGDTGFAGGTTFTMNLDHRSFNQHTIGKFKILATTADRSQFADGLANGGDLGSAAIWTELVPLSLTSSGGASVTINADNSVLLGGTNLASDTLTAVFNTELTGITGIRLEALQDATLPSSGPGRPGNGNFVLTEFTVDATPLGVLAVNIAQAAASTVVGASSAVNPPSLINDGVTADTLGDSTFILPPTAPQGLGYDLGGLATVDTLRIYQHTTGDRDRLETVIVHTSQGPITFAGLPDTDVIDLNLGGIDTGYVFIEPVSQQGTGTDSQLGIREVEVLTTGLVTPRENVALGAPVTLVGTGWNAGAGTPGLITDGTMDWGAGLTDSSTGVFNNGLSPTNGGVEIDLGSPEFVGILGIVQQTFGGGGVRQMIEDVRLEFSNDNFGSILSTTELTLVDGVVYQQVVFEGVTAQYVRISPLSQYGTGTDANIGIIELQLFTVPEPGAGLLVMLGLVGGVVGWRRRR